MAESDNGLSSMKFQVIFFLILKFRSEVPSPSKAAKFKALSFSIRNAVSALFLVSFAREREEQNRR